MSMWSLRWHFTNKSVTGAFYSIKGYSYSLSHSRTLWWRVRWLKQWNRWHFTNKSVTAASYSIPYSLSRSSKALYMAETSQLQYYRSPGLGVLCFVLFNITDIVWKHQNTLLSSPSIGLVKRLPASASDRLETELHSEDAEFRLQ